MVTRVHWYRSPADDVLTYGKTDADFRTSTHLVFDRLRDKNVTVNPRKTEVGLEEVEHVGHLVSTTGTSSTPEAPERP